MKRKKSARQKEYTKLYNRACALWKEQAKLRDGEECQVQKNFPTANLMHSEVIQVDHWISRSDKNLFFNPSNSLVVCSACNASKGWNRGPAGELIRLIVVNREKENAGLMLDIHMSHMPNLLWKDPEWLEKQVIPMLEASIQELKKNGH